MPENAAIREIDTGASMTRFARGWHWLGLAETFRDGEGFLEDVEIWKNKTRMDNPLLTEEDGAVYQHRRWYEQFYVDIADVTPR